MECANALALDHSPSLALYAMNSEHFLKHDKANCRIDSEPCIPRHLSGESWTRARGAVYARIEILSLYQYTCYLQPIFEAGASNLND